VDVVAVVDTRLVLVPAEPLLALVASDAQFARNLIASLAQRMHALVCDFEATTMHGARERLAAYLESLAESPEAARVTLPAPKKLIAARLGMTKETFSRALRSRAWCRSRAARSRCATARAWRAPPGSRIDLRQPGAAHAAVK
jgi:CRP-like cAMP-binding protein